MIETQQNLLARMLSYYRAPMSYPQMASVSSQLPTGLSGVLEMLNESDRSGDHLQRVANNIESPVAELRQAGYFYIKQVLFAEDADYYRVLGIKPDASPQMIRHHYRLLIRLFHPDKCPGGEAWDDLYAARINQAYNTLKNSGKRKHYDSRRKSANKSAAGDKPPVYRAHGHRARRPVSAAPSLLQRFQGSYLWQRQPKAVVVAGLMAGFLLVLLIAALSTSEPSLKMMENSPAQMADTGSLNQPPADERREAFMRAIKGTAYSRSAEPSIPEHDQLRKSPEPVPDDIHLPELIAATQELLMAESEALSIELALTEKQAVSEIKEPIPKSRETTTIEVVAAVQAKPQKQAGIPILEAKPTEQRQPVRRAAEPISAAASLPVEPGAVVASEKPAPIVVHPTRSATNLEKELAAQSDVLLKRYVRNYEAGNLLGILKLFSPQAEIDGSGGLASVANYFDRTFRRSKGRKMQLREVDRAQTAPGKVILDLQADFLETDYHGDVSQRYRMNLKLHLIESNKHLLISQHIQTRKQDVQ